MTVVIRMRDGRETRLDRGLRLDQVAIKVNNARLHGQLVQFELDLTPTGQMIWVDPAEVVSIRDDR